jgi:hypothetical protein
MNPVERPHRPFDPSVIAFVKERLIDSPKLVVTMAVLWREYRKFSQFHGFSEAGPEEFADYFQSDSRVWIMEG